ncbi:PREDICTED: uncharacterized protein LOC105584312 [Cercocebus atys]|uniref:uncharacterized protein LOC105584312 n=1 Tax=Cercocebus atys TaxID=9531 RepID=UPI0005F365E1|nr:PREDICTED: uncharacterized protein LOC105584312 [Cercocebus atys]
MASTYQVTGISTTKPGVRVPSAGQPARVTAGGQPWRGVTWGSSPSARSAGFASFGNENPHPSRGTERGNPAQVPCVRARLRGQRRQGEEEAEAGRLDPRHQLILPCYTHTHANNVSKKLSCDFVPRLSCSSLSWAGECFWGPTPGCWLIAAGGFRRRCDPGRPRTAYKGSREGQWPRHSAPVPVRAALWAARAAQCGRGCRERGRGKREGGRRPGEECGCVCGREGRPAASCFLSVSAGGGGGRVGAGSLVTRLANSKAELVSPS